MEGKRNRALLTGASGFAGSHALRHLLINTDWDLICPLTFSHRGLPERLVNAVGKDGVSRQWWDRLTIVRCDLGCPINDTTRKLFGHIDYIISYASESHVDRSITEPVPFIRNNVDIVLNLLELARVLKPKHFVLISTDEVYGPAADNTKHVEWSPIIPSNPYSASKACQEAIAISYWRTYAVPLVIINCMNLIGEMQDSEKFVPMIITKVLKNETVTIHATKDGGTIGSRFYLHARNLADAVLFLIRKGVPSKYTSNVVDRPDRWHVVGNQEVNNLEMAQLIARMLGKQLDFKFVDFHSCRPGHDLRYALDGKKIKKAGWEIPIEFEKSLGQLVKWTIVNPVWVKRENLTEELTKANEGRNVKNGNNKKLFLMSKL